MTTTFPVTEETTHSWQRKMDAVARYMLLGNLRLVAEQMEMSYNTLADWKRQPWWADMVETLRKQKKEKKANSLEKVIETGIDILKDRLENGDFVLNQKTGEIIRKPVAIKDAQVIVNQLIQRQNDLETMAEKYSHESENVQETLNTIAKEFQKLSRKMSKDTATTVDFVEIDNAVYDEREKGLQEGEREV